MAKVDNELVKQVMQTIKTGYTGIPSGLFKLDKSLRGGFQDGNLYVLGGRPAMGKTALALNIVCNAIKKGIRVTYYSLDMDKEKLLERLIYLMAEEPLPRESQMIDEETWTRLNDAAMQLMEANLIIDDSHELSVEEISWEKMDRPDYKESQLVIIDYIQLMRAHLCEDGYVFDNRQQEMNYICKELKCIARDNNIPIIVLSQLSRACEIRSNHHPILSDFRDSSAIEAMADVVLFLYRDEYYNLDTELKGIAEIVVAKNKFGYRSSSQYAYLPNYTMFRNLSRS